MKIIRFKKRFVSKILSGQKLHTLRKSGKYKKGDRILFCGEDDVPFAKGKINDVIDSLFLWGDCLYEKDMGRYFDYYSFLRRRQRNFDTFVRGEGFSSFEDFLQFFKKGEYERGQYFDLVIWSLKCVSSKRNWLAKGFDTLSRVLKILKKEKN